MTPTGPTWIDEAEDSSSQAWRDCVGYLEAYFAVQDGVPDFSGARFDSYGDNPWNRIVTDDIIAVSMLSVRVPGHATLRFLEREAGVVSSLLASIPTDLDLVDADETHTKKGSPAYDLWEVLRSSSDRADPHGTGPVATSKLLARKRPRLIPVYDRVVASAFGLSGPLQHWDRLHDWLESEPSRCQTLHELRRVVSVVPPSISDLRVLDVVLWMHGKSATDLKEQREPDTE